MARRPPISALIESRILLPAGLVVILLALTAIRNPGFFSSTGLAGAILVAAPLILASVAITPIAIVGRGGVDLSIGPLIGFVNVMIVTTLSRFGFDGPVAVIAFAIAAACVWQAMLAATIIYIRVPPILVSLAGYLILQGVNLVLLPRPGGNAPDWLADWGYGTSLLSPVLLVLVIAAVLWWVVHRSSAFQQIRLTGADERMAYTCGVDITIARWAAHMLAGVYAGLAAICFTGLIGSGDPTQGNTLSLQAITAVVLGGTSLAGGRGSALGSALGAVAMYLIFVVLSSFNFGAFSGFTTQMSFGLILVLSLTTTSLRIRNRPA